MPSLLTQVVASVLGIREQPGRALQDTLVDVLRPRVTLLLLDNCEHLVAACALLTDGLLRACPGLTVLTTSREPLGIAGETVWRVPPLSVPETSDGETSGGGLAALMQAEAVRLFDERARAALPGVRADRAARAGHRADLPTAGRHSAGDRAGGGPAARAHTGAARRSTGQSSAPADQRESGGAATPPDAARDGRLEPRAALGAGAGAVPPPVGVRRGLDAGGGGAGLRRG